jgi:type IV pilus assembly protein PilB
MRIVDKSKKIPKLMDLGIEGKNLELVKKAISLPNGVILTCGPTGSGKSTTLYAALTLLNKIDVNIMTLEDPVENQVDGINQSQVKPDIGYTFAYGLRTALRQDPDIIMV